MRQIQRPQRKGVRLFRIRLWRCYLVTKIKVLGFVVFAAAFAFATFAFSQQSHQFGSIGRLEANLARNGLQVTEGGSVQHFTPIQMYCSGMPLPNALYINKGAEYLAGLVPGSPRGGAATLIPQEFRLDTDEAVVLIGMTPPAEKYFSYQIYLVERHYQEGNRFLFNSAGDTVNLRTIHTIGRDPFNRPVVLIFTPDKGTDSRVRSALLAAGYPESIINTIVVPSEVLKLGLDETTDTLLIASRNAVFTQPNVGNSYIENPPFTLLRVTPQNRTPDPFPVPPLRIRGTGQTELEMTSALGKLHDAIIAQNAGLKATDYVTQYIAYEGYDYTQRGVTSLGDTRDALYLGSGYLPDFGLNNPLTLKDGEFLIAYGLKHDATGKATYTNINIYASETAKLALASMYSNDLENSADQYLPGDPNANVMYAFKISRSCADNDPFCMPVKQPDCASFTLEPDTLMGVIFRIYLEPRTNIGPAPPEILYDRLIKFSPNP